jgi:hypothetical protein
MGWEFLRRHRWGWVAIIAYIATLGGVRLWIFASGHPVTIADDEAFGLFVMFPLSASFFYSVTVYTFGLSGDLAARESLFPPRLLRLPMTSGALAGWPMVYGAVTIVIVWIGARSLAIYPPNFPIPIVWPAFLGVAMLAWAQALTWMPYGLRGARVVATVLWLVSIDVVVILAVLLKLPEWVVIAFLAPQPAIAFMAARAAVARARRGDVPDWAFATTTRSVANASALPFRSAARAQFWFEWRRCGLGLPLLVAFVVPVELALFFATGNTADLVFLLLVGVLITPPFLARAAGAAVRRSSPQANDVHGLPVFLATRPMTSAGLVAATLEVSIASTVLVWLFVGIATPIALMLSGTWALVTDRFIRLAAAIGVPRTVAIVVIVVAICILSTWRQLVQSLYVGLTGREWLVTMNVFLTLFVVFLLVPVAKWTLGNGRAFAIVWGAAPAALSVLVGAKLAGAVGVMRMLQQRQVLADRVLILAAAGWAVVVLTLYGTFAWFWGMPYLPRYLLAMLAILLVPIARITAAPLAFDWNRHR